MTEIKEHLLDSALTIDISKMSKINIKIKCQKAVGPTPDVLQGIIHYFKCVFYMVFLE